MKEKLLIFNLHITIDLFFLTEKNGCTSLEYKLY